MALETDPLEKLRKIKEEFDLSFSRPVSVQEEPQKDFVAIRIADALFAIALDDLAALERGRRIVPVPGARGLCLGAAGVRGEVVPVLCLAQLLGYEAEDPGDGRSQWLALIQAPGGRQTLAFAFAGFAGHLRIPAAEARAGEAFRTAGGVGRILTATALLSKAGAS